MTDIVGKKFNYLTILKDLGKGKILCRCDCGNEKDFNKYNVLSGHTKSCGCLRGVTTKKRRLNNLAGKKFNMLTILEELGSNKVLCRCDCGNTVETYKSNVIRGLTKSCGCLKNDVLKRAREKARFVLRSYPEYVGKKFAMLTVLKEFVIKKENNRYIKMVECKCDCGNIKCIQKESVVRGKVKSCGCLRTKSNLQKIQKMNQAVKKSYIGHKFGMLTIIEELGNNKVLCHCDCGNTVETYQNNVVSGITKSCGCLKDPLNKKTKD